VLLSSYIKEGGKKSSWGREWGRSPSATSVSCGSGQPLWVKGAQPSNPVLLLLFLRQAFLYLPSTLS